MKKYVKPELFYEHYELSQHIADCAWEWENLTSENVCAAVPDPATNPLWTPGLEGYETRLFWSEPICNLIPDKYLDYCYQGGGSHANLFKS